jgi:hypothetical protein
MQQLVDLIDKLQQFISGNRGGWQSFTYGVDVPIIMFSVA